jgi:TonB family protein
MNAFLKIPTVLALGALVATRLYAGFESCKIDPTFTPRLSPAMELEGITEGTVVFVVNIGADGRLTDWLVLGYTDPALVDTCLSGLKNWKITPARLDGQPVAAQSELTIHYRAEGVVVSQPASLGIDWRLQRIFGPQMVSRVSPAGELDGIPAQTAAATPSYAKEAADQGVRGVVRIHFYIDETGAVRMPAVKGDPNPYLANQALAAVSDWHFAPPTSGGRPTLVAVWQDFKFGT